MRKLLLREHVEHIALILRFVTRLFQHIFLAVELYACVVSGCDLVAAEKPCTLIAIKIFILLSRSPRESRALRVSCG